MPQMSPILWLNLFIYFISLYLIIMIMIYNLMSFYNNKISNNINNYKNLLFKLMW